MRRIRPIARRSFLRGMGGIAVALPALEIMYAAHELRGRRRGTEALRRRVRGRVDRPHGRGLRAVGPDWRPLRARHDRRRLRSQALARAARRSRVRGLGRVRHDDPMGHRQRDSGGRPPSRLPREHDVSADLWRARHRRGRCDGPHVRSGRRGGDRRRRSACSAAGVRASGVVPRQQRQRRRERDAVVSHRCERPREGRAVHQSSAVVRVLVHGLRASRRRIRPRSPRPSSSSPDARA